MGSRRNLLLEKYKAITTIPVHDIENAADFYGTILGLKKIGTNKVALLFDCGGATVGLYESGTAGTGQATCLWWTVDDVKATVKKLKRKGVVFDTNYDLIYTKRQGDIYLLDDDMQAAWFRDIDGNILGLGNF